MPLLSDSIFWIEVEKIKPNPLQPRKEFGEEGLCALAESIRQYGVLQPLVVTRKELETPDGGLSVEYELIAGERRLRASKIAGLSQVPVLIRNGEESDQMKLELAIIENVQREDLNPVDRAFAFNRLMKDFGYTHTEIGKKIGKSRMYVANTIRILKLPEEMTGAVRMGKMSEGHTRPLLMLSDRPAEQLTLFKEILFRHITVREAENLARRVAVDRVRKIELLIDADTLALEGELAEKLGTRVHIEKKETGGKITIDYFTSEDLRVLAEKILTTETMSSTSNLSSQTNLPKDEAQVRADDIPPEEEKAAQEQDDSELYNVSGFSV